MSSEIINLNVGGVLYTTTKQTLTKYSDSMLGLMFGGQHLPTALDQQGNYFIDRDGHMFRFILNFLRTGQLCLPQGFKDFDLLEAEVDFYQISDLESAFLSSKTKTLSSSIGSNSKGRQGYYIELLDCEETAYFYRFYSDPPKGINTDLKNSGLVISGPRHALLTLPLPEKTMKDLQTVETQYRTINVNNASCSKMAIVHHLQKAGWQLVTTSFSNNTNSDGSYMIHKYIWYLSGAL